MPPFRHSVIPLFLISFIHHCSALSLSAPFAIRVSAKNFSDKRRIKAKATESGIGESGEWNRGEQRRQKGEQELCQGKGSTR